MRFKRFFPIVASILSGAISLQGATCGNNQQGGKNPPCTASSPPPNDCSQTPPSSCTNNSISPYTGNERRVVNDLTVVGGVGEHRLQWTRYGNSRYTNGVSVLGNAHNWRHSYQWEFTVASDTNGPLTATVYGPDGASFTYTRVGLSSDYRSTGAATDTLSLNTTKDTFTLKRQNGWQYIFKITPSKAWHLINFLDSQQNSYTLTYDSNNRLVLVNEPAGRYLKISYATLSVSSAADVTLGTVADAAEGTWNTIIPTNTTAFHYLRYQGPDGKFSAIGDLQFLDADGNVLTGIPYGSSAAPVAGSGYAKAFDGDLTTSFISSIPAGDYVRLDFGTAVKVATIQFYTPIGKAADLTGGRFIGSNVKPSTISVVAKVEASDGRSITYDYRKFTDPTLPISWQELIAAHYGDGAVAAYTYVQPYPGSRPLLSSASDPRVEGKGTNLAWEYDNTNSNIVGYTVKEKNAITGTTILTVANSNSVTPIITYANGGKLVYGINHTTSLLDYSIDPLSRKTYFTYDQGGAGFLISIKDPLGRITRYTRTTYGNVASVTYPDGSTASWTRNEFDQLLTQTDTLGRTTTYTRDALHRVIRIDYPDTSFETYAYNRVGQVLEHQFQNGGVEHFAYDSKGLMLTYTDALNNVTTYTYTVHSASNPAPSGLVASVTDARGVTTNFEYNERGQQVAQHFADGSFKEFSYDAFGNLISAANELGNTWNYGYDEFNRLVSETDPLGSTKIYDYSNGIGATGKGCGACSSEEKPTLITLPSGKQLKITYDLAWQKLSETVAYGTTDAATTSYSYDSAGNVLKVTDAMGHVKTYVYDSRNRPTSVIDPLLNKTHWTYDAVGNRLTETRPDGGITTMVYDAKNRLLSSADPLGQTTHYTYNPDGTLASLVDAKGNVSNFSYDLLKRNTSKLYPDGTHEDWGYDANGNSISCKTRSGQISTSVYDVRNRITSTVWNDSTPRVTRSYDVAGRLLSLNNSVSQLSYSYDAANQILSETQLIGAEGTPHTVFYSYDIDSNLGALQYPSGTSITYSYTGRNQVAAISADGPPPIAQFTYDQGGNRTFRSLENGTVTNYEYDKANSLLSVSHASGSAVIAKSLYVYNAAGNRTKQTFQDGRSDSYKYDKTDQLTQVQYAGLAKTGKAAAVAARSVTYRYDALGNRISVGDSAGATPTSYTTNSLNQYTSVDAIPASYDLNGNLIALKGWAYKYDSQNRLISASNGASSVAFLYDARNRCVQRTINGVVTYFVYDGWKLLEERSNGVLLARYVQGIGLDEPVALIHADGSTSFYHQDGLGNVMALSATDGTLIERYLYDVFGKATVIDKSGAWKSGGSTGNRMMFTGREWIAEAGLYDYRNRYYQPQISKWISADPIGENGGINLYTYVGNSPINWIDSDGLVPAPTLPGGQPAPPPISLPDGKNGQPNSWRPVAGSGRRQNWAPVHPVPGSQPRASWHDSDTSHWDFDDGKGGPRQHFDEEGKPMTPEQAHGSAMSTAASVGLGAAGAYCIYRGIRLLPSLVPPLWPTIPANMALP
jgi:RHS repeat-associated protein